HSGLFSDHIAIRWPFSIPSERSPSASSLTRLATSPKVSERHAPSRLKRRNSESRSRSTAELNNSFNVWGSVPIQLRLACFRSLSSNAVEKEIEHRLGGRNQAVTFAAQDPVCGHLVERTEQHLCDKLGV